MTRPNTSIVRTIAPWLSIENASAATEFYKKAFDAVEAYRLETPDGGLVVRLSVNGAEFWISGNATDNKNADARPLSGNNLRLILTVSDPDERFEKALEAGATEVFPVGEEYGWKLGRLTDPFGLDWEIGYQL